MFDILNIYPLMFDVHNNMLSLARIHICFNLRVFRLSDHICIPDGPLDTRDIKWKPVMNDVIHVYRQ